MIALTEEMRERLDNALAANLPCIVASATKDAYPTIAPKGSVMVFDSEHLAFWERAKRGMLEDMRENPHVAVLYLDRPNKLHWRFFGDAIIHESGPIREAVMNRTVKAEIDRDPERKGVAVLIRVDKIVTLAGVVVQQR